MVERNAGDLRPGRLQLFGGVQIHSGVDDDDANMRPKRLQCISTAAGCRSYAEINCLEGALHAVLGRVPANQLGHGGRVSLIQLQPDLVPSKHRQRVRRMELRCRPIQVLIADRRCEVGIGLQSGCEILELRLANGWTAPAGESRYSEDATRDFFESNSGIGGYWQLIDGLVIEGQNKTHGFIVGGNRTGHCKPCGASRYNHG